MTTNDRFSKIDTEGFLDSLNLQDDQLKAIKGKIYYDLTVGNISIRQANDKYYLGKLAGLTDKETSAAIGKQIANEIFDRKNSEVQITRNSTGSGKRIPTNQQNSKNKRKKISSSEKQRRKAGFLIGVSLLGIANVGALIGNMAAKAKAKFEICQSMVLDKLTSDGDAILKHDVPEGALLTTNDVELTDPDHFTNNSFNLQGEESVSYVAISTIEELGGNIQNFAHANAEIPGFYYTQYTDGHSYATEEDIKRASDQIDEERSLEASRILEAYRNSCHHEFMIKLGLLGENSLNNFADQINYHSETKTSTGRGK